MKSKILFSALFVAFLSIANISMAQNGHYERHHPRHAEVNHRLHHQNHRIHQKMKNGDISRSRAYHMHRHNNRIHHEERRMAYRNGGHLSRHDYRKLNHQENRMGRRIFRS